MGREIAALVAGLLMLTGTGAVGQEPTDNPNVTTVPRPPVFSAPTTTRDPRGDFSTAPTTSRFQRKAPPPVPAPVTPVPQPVAAAPAPAAPALAQAPAVRSATPAATTATPAAAAPRTTIAPTAAPVAAAAPTIDPAAPSPVATDRPAAGAPAAASQVTVPAEVTALPSREVAVEDDRRANWPMILIAIGVATVAAGLAAAKIFMPWPRPRVSCDYRILPQPLVPGSVSLDAPEISVRGEALMGAPVLAGFAIAHERWEDD